MRALAVLLAALGCPGAPSARELQQQAAAERKSGAIDKARTTAEAAIAAARLERDFTAEALAANTLGEVLLYRGQFDAAVERFERAAELAAASRDARREADYLANAGGARFYQGRYDEAYRFYREAERRTEANGRESWATEMRQVIAINLATLYQRLGMLPEALAIYKAQRDRPGMSDADRAQFASNLGALYRRLGDPWLAASEYRKALALLEGKPDPDLRLGVLMNQAIAEAFELRNLRAAEATLRQVLALAERDGNSREAAQARLYLGEVHKRGGQPKAAAREFETALASARKLKAPEEEWKALFGLERHREAIAVIESLRASLGTSQLRSRFLAGKRDVYDALISARLREGADFDELLDLAERSRARSLSDRLLPSISSAAEIRAKLGSDAILISQWQQGNQQAMLWTTYDKSGVARLLDGIAALEDGSITRVVFVPDGGLESSPDMLLYRNTRLIDRFEIAVLPAASLLTRGAPDSRVRPPWSTSLTGIGAPDLSDRVLAGDRHWKPLRRAAEELHDAASRIGGRARVFTGHDATRRNFLSHAREGFVLHFATHAAADIESPDRSRIFLGGPSGGYLYHSEIAALPLAGTHLTVLSACETERGEDVRGEGVQSLGSAFLAAGSASVVTTLWRVDDDAAAEMMKGFYAALANGYPKAAALRQAKLRLIRSGTPMADPRHWSAFVLVGDGWSPLPAVIPWAAAVGPAGLAVATALWWVKSRRGSSR